MSSDAPVDVAVVSAAPQGPVDGIWDFSVHLVDALQRHGGVAARLVVAGRDGFTPAGGGRRSAGVRAGAVILQYNPFSFGRWGFAPWLPWRALKLDAHRVALMIHEPFVPMDSWRAAAMGAWQRAQLLALWTTADVVLTAIEAWERAGRALPRRPVHHVPVGSNVPDMRSARAAQRERLGVGDDDVVLTAFGTGHPARRMELVERSVLAVAAAGLPATVLNLGSGAPPLRGLDGAVRVLAPGALPAGELARHLAAGDVFLAPFADGVSTRRTTVMAALQHELAVVGTDGPLTGRLLRADPGLRLVAAGDAVAYAGEVCRLAADGRARRELAQDGRALYDRCFDWPAVARRTLDCLA